MNGWTQPTDEEKINGRGESIESIRITVPEASVLQSFDAEYPWCGNKSQQYQGVGNAIPPLLAAAALRAVI